MFKGNFGNPNKPQTTEWDDQQRRIGNLAPLEVSADEAALREVVYAVADHHSTREGELGRLTEEQLTEKLEDDGADDDAEAEFLEEYRRRRIEEMKKAAMKGRWGTVRDVSEAMYESEVTQVSEKTPVVVLMYKAGLQECEVLMRICSDLARKFSTVKFVRIISTAAVRHYPDHMLPTLLVYKDGDLAQQFVRLNAFAGAHTTADDVEWELAMLGVLKTEMREPPKTTREGRIMVNIHTKGGGGLETGL